MGVCGIFLVRDMNRAAAPKQCGMNQQKFEELFSKYRSMVYRTAKSITGRRQDALDIQQTVFLRLIEQAETLESTANLTGYLYQTAVNEARQRFRSEGHSASFFRLTSLRRIATIYRECVRNPAHDERPLRF